MAPSEYIDLFIVALLVYVMLVWSKRTRAHLALAGLFMIAAVYLGAKFFNLVLTTSVLHGFFTAILVIVVVIFQREIRLMFERMAVLGLGSKKRKKDIKSRHMIDELRTLCKTLFELAASHTGAIVVLKGRDPLDHYVQGGIELGGKSGDAILKSIFDPGSAGHDGAVIIDNGEITKFACHLPLSKYTGSASARGTRHSAALGLSEITDALCLVVSEERGTVSCARFGKMKVYSNPENLEKQIVEFLAEVSPHRKHFNPFRWIYTNVFEKVAAVGITFLLWFVVIHSSEIVYKSYMVPVNIQNLSQKLRIVESEPASLELGFSAPRRGFYGLKPEEDIQVRVDASKIKRGTQSLRIADSDINFPSQFTLREIMPTRNLRIVTELNTGTDLSVKNEPKPAAEVKPAIEVKTEIKAEEVKTNESKPVEVEALKSETPKEEIPKGAA